jgi:GTP-binding protein
MNIVIVGRPNVGKSSLFNRLLGRKRSLVLDTPGVTRDRIVEPVEWWVHAKQYQVNLIDTGGLGHEFFKKEIQTQVNTALEEADIVYFVMDIRAGLTRDDQEVFHELRRSGLKGKTPVIAILNKADHDKLEDEVHQFYELGLENMITISAEHCLGIDDLKDMTIDILEKNPEFEELTEITEESNEEELDSELLELDEISDEDLEEESEKRIPRIPSIAIVGQPNVGKSTMLNAICGEDRAIVSPIAGTTVDSIDTRINWNGKDFIFVDTAGIRRKNKTEQGIEVLSVVQTRKALERASLAILMIDAEKGVYDQDEKIAGMIEEAGCSVIIVLNKWDTQVNNNDFSQKLAEEQLRKQIRFLGWAPLVFTTAKDAVGLDRLYRLIQGVLEQRVLKLTTKEITEHIRAEVAIQSPDNAKFYMVQQTSRNPPTFVAHVSDPRKIHFSTVRHLIKTIRERWGYQGTPIRFNLSKAKNAREK